MKNNNWFENHPKTTLVSLVLLIIFILSYATEKIFSYRHNLLIYNFALPHRAIRLREFKPSMVESYFPSRGSEKYDTLVRKAYTLRIDNNGFIIPSERYSHPDLSLVFLGGSTTTCQFIDEKYRFPYLTGVLLENKLGIKINSYNASRIGNNSLHSIDILINKIIPINPQIIVMMHNVNDITILLYEKTYWNNHFSRSPIIDMNKEFTTRKYLLRMRDRIIPNISAQIRIISNNIKDWLRVSNKNNDEFAKVRGKSITIDKAKVVKQFGMNLQTFISICQIRGIVPVLMTMPSRFKDHPDKIIEDVIENSENNISYHDYKDLYDSFNELIRKKAKENRIAVIDLAKDIPQEKKYMYDTVHYTEYGSKQIAHIISEHLQPIIKSLPKNNGKMEYKSVEP